MLQISSLGRADEMGGPGDTLTFPPCPPAPYTELGSASQQLAPLIALQHPPRNQEEPRGCVHPELGAWHDLPVLSISAR